MRRAACAWLLLACLLWSPKPLYAQLDAQYLQIDPHMRTHAGQQYHYSYMGSKPAAAYIGLGAAAQAAFTEADHITGVLLDDAGVATAAITQPALDPQPILKRHKRVKHGRHTHKRSKTTYDGSSGSSSSSNSYEPEVVRYEEVVFDIPSEDTHKNHHRSRGDSSSSSSYPAQGNDGGVRRMRKTTRGDDEEDVSFFHNQKTDLSSSSGGGKTPKGFQGSSISSISSSHATGSGGYSSSSGVHSSTPEPKSGVCKQVLLEEEEVEVVFSATRDKATITTLLGTCANPTHPLPTLGGGCVVECEHLEDLCMLTPLNSHAFIAPANFKSIDNYYPVMCSYRADGPLKGSCNIVMKVACCSDVARTDKSGSQYKATIQHKVPEYDPGSEDGDDDGEYYAVVKSKLLRIPLSKQKS